MGLSIAKARTILGKLNPAASDVHPADVVVFTSLASSHQAVLHSPRLNELRCSVGWRPYGAAACYVFTNDSFFGYKKYE